MKKVISLLIVLSSLLIILAACQNKQEDGLPPKLDVEKVSERNVEDWKINIITRKEHKKWVYDIEVTYLKDTPVDVTVTPSDTNKYGYKGALNEPLTMYGSYDYEPSVYSKDNNKVKVQLDWKAKDSNKRNHGEANFKLIPLYKN